MLVSETKEYASEAAHFYWPDGRSCHQLPYKDKKRKGEMRNTTLRDARELGLYPSVSAILGVAEKKGLDTWKKEQVAEASWYERIEDALNMDQWVQNVMRRAEAEMTKARDLGTEIHGAIECFLRGSGTLDDLAREELPHSAHIEAAVAALCELGVWGQPFSAERTFASPLGYGGTIDLKIPTSYGMLIVDFKCVDRLDKKLAYDDRCAQLCAYAVGSSNNENWINDPSWPDCSLVNIFISTSEPGEYLIHEWSEEEKEHGWALFEASFALWKVINRFDPLAP